MPSVTALKNESPLATEVELLFRVAYRLTGDADDAEDLVQDVCERALRKAPAFASSGDLRRWLLRVLHNRFIDGRRHRQRSPIVADSAGMPTEEAVNRDLPCPEGLASQKDAETALMRAFERLEPTQQMLLMLRAEGYDLGEIAEITALEKPALSSRLHRARASLAKYLKDERLAPRLRAVPEKQ